MFRGGARVGSFNATWPFATLRITADALVLKVLFSEYSLQKVQIVRLEYFNTFLAVGVKIVHTTTKLDEHAIFWSSEPAQILAAAEKLGFPTKQK